MYREFFQEPHRYEFDMIKKDVEEFLKSHNIIENNQEIFRAEYIWHEEGPQLRHKELIFK